MDDKDLSEDRRSKPISASSYEDNHRLVTNRPDICVHPLSEAKPFLLNRYTEEEGEWVEFGIVGLTEATFDPKTGVITLTGENPVVSVRDSATLRIIVSPSQAKRLLRELGQQSQRIPVIEGRVQHEVKAGEHVKLDQGGKVTSQLTNEQRDEILKADQAVADSTCEVVINNPKQMFGRTARWFVSDLNYDYTDRSGKVCRVTRDRHIAIEIDDPIEIDDSTGKIQIAERQTFFEFPLPPQLKFEIDALSTVKTKTGENITRWVHGSFYLSDEGKTKLSDALLAIIVPSK